jgi:hypothetical protein
MGFWSKLFNKSNKSSSSSITYHYPISREAILAGDTSGADDIEDDVAKAIKKNKGIKKWLLTISGYDEDKRELYEIPEVRRWCTKVFEKKPYFLLFLEDIGWFILCVLEIRIIKSSEGKIKYSTNKKDLTTFKRQVQNGTTKYFGEFFIANGISPTSPVALLLIGSSVGLVRSINTFCDQTFEVYGDSEQ